MTSDDDADQHEVSGDNDEDVRNDTTREDSSENLHTVDNEEEYVGIF